MSQYFGHSENEAGEWQTLLDHSTGVAERIRTALEGWVGQDEGVFAGLAHDLGKYPDSFQDRLRGIGSGYDHWSAGTHLAIQQGMLAAAFAVYGHHVGLPRMGEIRSLRSLEEFGKAHPLQLKLTAQDPAVILERMAEDGLVLPKVSSPILPTTKGQSSRGGLESMLDIRRLFSALTDSDFLDTEAHMRAEARAAGPSLKPDRFLGRLNEYLKSPFSNDGRSKACGASTSTGVDGLPTGGGRTTGRLHSHGAYRGG